MTQMRTQTSTFTRELECELTQDELQLYGKLLAERTNELAALDEQRKKVAAEYGSKLKAVKLEQSRLAIARDKGKELRPVECLKRWNNGVIEVVRLDTDKVVDVHPATIADRQVEFPGLDGHPDDDGNENIEDQAARVLHLIPPSLVTPSPDPGPRQDAPGWYAGAQQYDGDSEAAPSASAAEAGDVGEVVESSIGAEVFIGEGMTDEEAAEAIAASEARAEAREIAAEQAKSKANGKKKSSGSKSKKKANGKAK